MRFQMQFYTAKFHFSDDDLREQNMGISGGFYPQTCSRRGFIMALWHLHIFIDSILLFGLQLGFAPKMDLVIKPRQKHQIIL